MISVRLVRRFLFFRLLVLYFLQVRVLIHFGVLISLLFCRGAMVLMYMVLFVSAVLLMNVGRLLRSLYNMLLFVNNFLLSILWLSNTFL
ncbi:hypothetical protein C2G38_429371 [Gigaspora rosea]|uniref:Uncharacterized protein n=1 Tax=Gigaspora rosea TaxID=44941 RepID=A0A397UBA2_9GLOM|nr:hypothetical protein C2G38_429371 [Gigaspora rosea]